MKKITWLIPISVVLVLLFTGCSGDSGEEVARTPAKKIPCEDIRDEFERSACFMNRAIKGWDESLCEENITGEDHRSMCLAVIRADESLCEKINLESVKDSCFWNVAGEKFSGDICEKITNEGDREDCFYHYATDFRNETICKKMSKGHKKDRCFRIIAGLKNDEIICENIDDEDTKYWCLAVAKDNPALCEKMSHDEDLCANDYLFG